MRMCPGSGGSTLAIHGAAWPNKPSRITLCHLGVSCQDVLWPARAELTNTCKKALI